ncbi:hypothetical protein FGB62_172g011 [Gracilaria domingensis]|nr:hypothetical protein FGB62_172g011 [Gracilaria domingensis]
MRARLGLAVAQPRGARGAQALLGGCRLGDVEGRLERLAVATAFDLDVHAVIVIAKHAARAGRLRAAKPREAQHIHAVRIDVRNRERMSVILVPLVIITISHTIAGGAERDLLVAAGVIKRHLVVFVVVVHVAHVDDGPAREAAAVVVALDVHLELLPASKRDGGRVGRLVLAKVVGRTGPRTVLERADATRAVMRDRPRIRNRLMGRKPPRKRGEHEQRKHGLARHRHGTHELPAGNGRRERGRGWAWGAVVVAGWNSERCRESRAWEGRGGSG